MAESASGSDAALAPALELMDSLVAALERTGQELHDFSAGAPLHLEGDNCGDGAKGPVTAGSNEEEEGTLTLEHAEAAVAARRQAAVRDVGASGRDAGETGCGGPWERVEDWQECAIGAVCSRMPH